MQIIDRFTIPWAAYSLTVTGTNSWSTTRALGIPIQTLNGSWFIFLDIMGTHSSAITCTLTITGITFKNLTAYGQAGAATGYNQGRPGSCYASPNASTIFFTYPSTYVDTYSAVSGWFELESKPTFME